MSKVKSESTPGVLQLTLALRLPDISGNRGACCIFLKCSAVEGLTDTCVCQEKPPLFLRPGEDP